MFNFADKEVASKIKSLWSQYAREKVKYLARAKKSGSGVDDVMQIKWTHFKALKFLDSSLKARTSKSNMEMPVRTFGTSHTLDGFPLLWNCTLFTAIK